MKKNLLKISLFAFITLLAVGCSDDDSNNDNNAITAAEGELVANVDGEQFTASTQVGATFFGGTFNLTAIDPSTQETITITVVDAGEGTFDLGDVNQENGADFMVEGEDNSFVSVAEGGSGQIKITNLDLENKKVSGTFNFVATREMIEGEEIIVESVEVTEGSFNNIDLSTTVAGDSDSTLDAKVDGNDINPDSVTAVELSVGGNTTITITAINNATGQNVGLSFPGDFTVGSYEFTGGFSDYKGFYTPNLGGETNQYFSESGMLTITSYDSDTGVIEGTFNFSAKRLDPNDPDVTYEITEGSFSVEI